MSDSKNLFQARKNGTFTLNQKMNVGTAASMSSLFFYGKIALVRKQLVKIRILHLTISEV